MENLLPVYAIEMRKEEKVDGQLVYRVLLPLNPPHTVADGSPEAIQLDLWCYEETDDRRYVLGHRVSGTSDLAVVEAHFGSAIQKAKPYAGSIRALIESAYVMLEASWYAQTTVTIRDFAYPAFNPIHFGHYGTNTTEKDSDGYQAKAVFKYDGLIEGEMSIEEGELLQVLKSLGNGWVCATKLDSKDATGLVPENYIQRISPST